MLCTSLFLAVDSEHWWVVEVHNACCKYVHSIVENTLHYIYPQLKIILYKLDKGIVAS
jgi:hypothetical protein